MVNVFNELIMSEASAEDQLIHWKDDTRGIFNCLKIFMGFVYSFTKLTTYDHDEPPERF